MSRQVSNVQSVCHGTLVYHEWSADVPQEFQGHWGERKPPCSATVCLVNGQNTNGVPCFQLMFFNDVLVDFVDYCEPSWVLRGKGGIQKKLYSNCFRSLSVCACQGMNKAGYCPFLTCAELFPFSAQVQNWIHQTNKEALGGCILTEIQETTQKREGCILPPPRK